MENFVFVVWDGFVVMSKQICLHLHPNTLDEKKKKKKKRSMCVSLSPCHNQHGKQEANSNKNKKNS